MNNYERKLYENIRNKRIALGMTQTELAKKMGYCGKSMISRIEAGQIDLPQSKIIEFAQVFGTTPGELMDNSQMFEDELFQKRKLLFDMSEKASEEDLDKIIKIVDTLVGDEHE